MSGLCLHQCPDVLGGQPIFQALLVRLLLPPQLLLVVVEFRKLVLDLGDPFILLRQLLMLFHLFGGKLFGLDLLVDGLDLLGPGLVVVGRLVGGLYHVVVLAVVLVVRLHVPVGGQLRLQGRRLRLGEEVN